MFIEIAVILIVIVIVIVAILFFFVRREYFSAYSDDGEKKLQELDNRIKTLQRYLNDHFPNQPEVQRFNQRYSIEILNENKSETFTLNKRQSMHLCLYDKENKKFYETNDLMFVTLHELAHIMNESWNHTQEFWDLNRWLLTQANAAGVYRPTNYESKPVKYCNTVISGHP